MNMNKGVIVGIIIAVLVVAGGAYALTKKDNKANPSTDTTAQTDSTATTNNQSSNTSQNSSEQNSSTTITYTNNGFSPATLTVKAGTTITIKNDSSSSLQFDSDPHPEHTDDPELNVGVIAPGKSATMTVTTTGSHGYHNHLNPSDTGTIVVQ